jgi:peptide/nickel transport system permease protein
LKGYIKYFRSKLIWFAITFVIAFVLNFFLPRLMPGDPVAAIMRRATAGMQSQAAIQRVYEQYQDLFGTNKPIIEQFFIYVGNAFRGDFGLSLSQYPRSVSQVLSEALWWTIGLQLPAILVGWVVGNLLGALAAYLKGGLTKLSCL